VNASGGPLSADEEQEELEERMAIPLPDDRVLGKPGASAKFWPTVVVIELTDIAFAVDSILAAIGVVGAPPPGHPSDAAHPKMWVIITGGIIGVILMRFAAVLFIRLLERFPRFEMAAYLLVAVIGAKLLADWGFNSEEHPHRLNFHDVRHPEFWVFWVAMTVCFLTGFLPSKHKRRAANAPNVR
jgi:predicted tellurium resistance membrane protein TerC